MSTKTEFNKTPKYPVFEMKEKGRLILTPEIINQIMYLHASVGSTEWSGILLYDVISGNPSQPSKFVLEAKHIFLMDIGSAGATEYSPDGDIVDMYDKIEGSMQMKTGHVHSHHTMQTFFSATDTDELMTNVDKYNYYLSLIVNFSGNYSCKVAFLSEVKNTTWMHYIDDHGKLKQFKQDNVEKHMVIINMSIVMGYENSFFYERLTEVNKKIEEAKKAAKKKNTQKSLDFSKTNNYYNYHSTIKPDPDNLTNTEVEHLTRNILALDTDLNETRTVYTMLHEIVKDSSEDELEYYYQYFILNAELIIGEFFDNRVLTDDQLKKVLKEISMCINRFVAIKAIKKLVERITNILENYSTFTDDDRPEETFEDINNASAIDAEFKQLANE